MIKQTALNGITDCHTHCGGIDVVNFHNMIYPCTQDVNVLHTVIQANAVDHAIAFPMPSTLYYDIRKYCNEGIFSPSGFQDIPFGLENQYLLAQIKTFEIENILPFVSISLQDKIKEQCKQIEKWINEYCVYGFKLHTKADHTSLRSFLDHGKAFLELAADNSMPFVLHSACDGIAEPNGVFELAERNPDVRFSVAHLAGLNKDFFHTLKQFKKSFNNVFFDCAPCLFICSRQLSQDRKDSILDLDYQNPISVLSYFVEEFSDCLLWGTDCPWLFSGSILKTINNRISYSHERNLYNSLEVQGKHFSSSTVNRFLFG